MSKKFRCLIKFINSVVWGAIYYWNYSGNRTIFITISSGSNRLLFVEVTSNCTWNWGIKREKISMSQMKKKLENETHQVFKVMIFKWAHAKCSGSDSWFVIQILSSKYYSTSSFFYFSFSWHIWIWVNEEEKICEAYISLWRISKLYIDFNSSKGVSKNFNLVRM